MLMKKHKIMLFLTGIVVFIGCIFIYFYMKNIVLFNEPQAINQFFDEHNMTVELIGSDETMLPENYRVSSDLTKLKYTKYFYHWKDRDDLIICAVCASNWDGRMDMVPQEFRRVVFCDYEDVLEEDIKKDLQLPIIDLSTTTVDDGTALIKTELDKIQAEYQKYNISRSAYADFEIHLGSNQSIKSFSDLDNIKYRLEKTKKEFIN